MRIRNVYRRPSAPAMLLVLLAMTLGLALPSGARAERLGVRVSTDRGEDAVYNSGDALEISAKVSGDAYLLVYEIDAEGALHLLFPFERAGAYVEGPTTVRLPSSDSDYQLVVEGPVGEGYIVAIASREPFGSLPWYLRPYDARAEELGYHGDDADAEADGVTAEGRIVGDPFVAMERIRRRILADPADRESFATDYASYYVHQAVRYPRYLCYDCHRPGQWAWWDGFDPYYTSCTAMDFRVNATWWWGPSYWFGQVPYFVYVYRPDCPPRFRGPGWRGTWYSSWDGWKRWSGLWGGSLHRYKSPPPAGYVPPPSKFDPIARRTGGRSSTPPGFLVSAHGSPRTSPLARGVGGAGRQRPRIGSSSGARNDGLFRQNRGRQGGITFLPRDRASEGSRGVRVERPMGRERPLGRYERPGDRDQSGRSTGRLEDRGRASESPRFIDRERERSNAPPREFTRGRGGESGYSRPAPRSYDPPRESRTWSPPAADRGRPSPPPSPSVRESPRSADRPAQPNPAPQRWEGGRRSGR
jgi:hypothetical protein